LNPIEPTKESKSGQTSHDFASWLVPRARGLSLSDAQVQMLLVLLQVDATASISAMAACEVLEDLHTDAETRLTCLLWPLSELDLTANAELANTLETLIDRPTRELLNGHAQAKKVWPIHAAHAQKSGAEGIRRLLLVLIKDVRVVLILLAEQLILLRGLSKADSALQRDAAQVTSDIHAPLANRLGVWQIKWELEDLAFRYLKPDLYKRVAGLLDERRADREGYIEHFVQRLTAALRESGIEADVAGRPKHIFSIYKKMQKKGLEFNELFDVRAVRVIVKDLASCYAALGAVHNCFQPIPGEFDDYIAKPKGNNYRSLHTAVIGPQEKSVEIQIRTLEMHEHAELGVAAHWRYKEGEGASSAADFERKINWMRQLLDHREVDGDDEALMAGFSTELLEDRVYLLTPKGQVIELPAGSTVLDFAYMVHTSVGHRCRGAKVNGRIVQLSFQPKSGDQVEVLTGKEIQPNRHWLDSQAGYMNSPRARAKVRAYFNQLDLAQNLSAGRELLERECKRLGLQELPLEALCAHFGVKKSEDFLTQIALGDLTMGQISRAVHELEAKKSRRVGDTADKSRRAGDTADKSRRAGDTADKSHRSGDPTDKSVGNAESNSKLKQGIVKPLKHKEAKLSKDAVVIDGISNLMISMSNCCRPLPGDAIIGFITRGRGLAVHRSDCKDVKHLATVEPERILEVQWGSAPGQKYRVQMRLQAFDRQGLLRDVGTVLAEAKVAVLGSSTRLIVEESLAEMDYTIEVNDFDQLSKLFAKLRSLPNVLEVRRI
jgi:GTP pyrophosphokinase